MNLERIYSMKKQNAFTLAEVLITLGIIGVVAAMTMPTLLNSTQDKQFITAYKKALSVMSQAGTTNYALEDTDFTSGNAYDILKSKMNVTAADDTNKKLTFNDGMTISFGSAGTLTGCKDPNIVDGKRATTGTANNVICTATLDVNGTKGPGASGRDQYTIIIGTTTVWPGDEAGVKIVETDKNK